MPTPSPTPIVLAVLVGLTAGRVDLVAAQVPDTAAVPLQDLVYAALEREFALRAARNDVALAESDILAARAAFDPTVQLSADLSQTDLSAITAGGPMDQTLKGRTVGSRLVGSTPLSTQYSVQVNSVLREEDPLLQQANASEYDNLVTFALTQPLLRGFGSAAGSANLRAAHRAADASQARLTRQTAETIATVEQLYWLLGQREAEEGVAAASLRRAEVLLDRNRELRQLDRITEVDLQTALLGVAARRSTLLRATQARRDAGDDLIYVVYGIGAAERLQTLGVLFRTADAPDLSVDLPSLGVAQARAWQARRDLAAERFDLESLRAVETITGNALLPTLNVTASYTTLVNNVNKIRLSAQRPGDIESTGWRVAVQASFPLINSQARADHSEITWLEEQQQIAVSAAENRVLSEVRQAHRGVVMGRRILATADSAVGFAQRQYDMENQRLELGLSESFRLLQHEDQIAQAELSQIAATFGLAQAFTAYQLATEVDLLAKYNIPLEGN